MTPARSSAGRRGRSGQNEDCLVSSGGLNRLLSDVASSLDGVDRCALPRIRLWKKPCRPHTHTRTHRPTHTDSLTHSLTPSLPQSLTHSFTHSLLPLNHSPPHSLIHSLTHTQTHKRTCTHSSGLYPVSSPPSPSAPRAVAFLHPPPWHPRPSRGQTCSHRGHACGRWSAHS